jgi:uncharacterized RDD family membrane protein YckC
MNEVETDAPVPAALWRRGIARFIDYFAMCWVLFALQVLSITSWVDSTSTALVTIAGLYALLEIVYVAKRGQTPAKEWLKIRVSHPGHRAELGWRVAIARWVVPGIALALPFVLPWWSAPLALVILGLPALFDPQRRTVYDRLAGTGVFPYDAKFVEGPIKSRQQLVRNSMDRNIAAVAGEPRLMSDDETTL